MIAQLRKLWYVVAGNAVVLVASNAGKDQHPAWCLNLQANPEAEMQVGRERRRRQRTERSIPLVLLEPV